MSLTVLWLESSDGLTDLEPKHFLTQPPGCRLQAYSPQKFWLVWKIVLFERQNGDRYIVTGPATVSDHASLVTAPAVVYGWSSPDEAMSYWFSRDTTDFRTAGIKVLGGARRLKDGSTVESFANQSARYGCMLSNDFSDVLLALTVGLNGRSP